MPENLVIGLFVFGAVLILISLLGGGFKIFTIVVSSSISNPIIRVLAFILGITSMFLALIPDMMPVPLPESPNTPSPGEVVYFPPGPQPTQTSLPPTVIYNTPTPQIPSPTDFAISYWQNVSDGRYEVSWAQLSPRFRQVMHNNEYTNYVQGYQQINLCSIVVSDVNLIHQDLYSAVVAAHFTYYTRAQCNSSEYNFEMWLVYDGASNLWLFDKNIKK